ncbi:unnamed protein product [Cuscuta campestris]|uniref:Uncharacterized protein n=1 Tax=Cuscuta campestris TaxID=132261 RepID=A0A484N324_9ASTE|nr:unnamed protein product [Cuscuta campestris]
MNITCCERVHLEDPNITVKYGYNDRVEIEERRPAKSLRIQIEFLQFQMDDFSENREWIYKRFLAKAWTREKILPLSRTPTPKIMTKKRGSPKKQRQWQRTIIV